MKRGWADSTISSAPVSADSRDGSRSEEHTSELQSLMRISYAVFCLKKKNITQKHGNKEHYNRQNRRNKYKNYQTNRIDYQQLSSNTNTHSHTPKRLHRTILYHTTLYNNTHTQSP